MNVGVAHHLPTGGALRTLSDWLAGTNAEAVTIYTRDAAVHAFAPLPERVQVVEAPLRPGRRAVDELLRVWRSPRDGKALAKQIDAAGHDVVLCFPSRLTQALDVIPFLRTPSVYYAPEPLRSAYEPPEMIPLPANWRGRITRWGINPIERRRRKLDRRYIRAAPHVMANSEFTAQQLRRVYGVTCKVLPSGVDADAFRPAAEPRERFVLAVGALSPLKGHELVIDAVAALPAPRPQLVVVGDRGESEPLLRARAVRAGVQLVVRQGIPFSEVVRLYQRASVVACGQIREPLGLVPLEAMACATPVVAVDDGGFRETIRNGETGLLVPRHPRAMAAALARVLENASLAARLGQAGRTHVVQRWSSQRMIRAFDAVLTQVADEKHSVGGNPHSSSE